MPPPLQHLPRSPGTLPFSSSCQQSDAYWYTGRHCDQSVSKVGVAVGVALGLAVLLLLILLLAALLCWQCRRRRKDHRYVGEASRVMVALSSGLLPKLAHSPARPGGAFPVWSSGSFSLASPSCLASLPSCARLVTRAWFAGGVFVLGRFLEATISMGRFANSLKLQSKQEQQTIGRSSRRHETSPKVPPVKQGPLHQRAVYWF